MRRWSVGWRVRVSVLATLWCALSQSVAAPSLQAQVDPRGAIRTIRTTHLRIHVRRGQEAIAMRAAGTGCSSITF